MERGWRRRDGEGGRRETKQCKLDVLHNNDRADSGHALY